MFSTNGFVAEEDELQPETVILVSTVTVEEDEDRSVVAAKLTTKDGDECEEIPED